MSVYNLHQGVVAGTAAAGGGAVFDTTLIGNSIWLEGSRTSGDAMTRTWGSPSNQDRWIWATWYQPLRVIDAESKRNNLFASGSSSHGFYLNHTSTSSTFNLFHRDNAGNEGGINTAESYRDTTSWIHVLVDYDSANANAADRISLYINGVRTGVNSGTRPAQNNDLQVNVSGQTARIGQDLSTTPDYHVQGYLAQTVFLDNKSIANGDLAITDFLDTFTFGTNGSQIIPKADADIIALASAAGNNSFCLDYSDASNIVNDASTKTNHFTAVSSSVTATNQSSHTPSLSYPVLNALDPTTATAINGSLDFAGPAADDKAAMRTTIGIPDDSGKYYWEYLLTGGSNDALMFGIAGSGEASGGYDDWVQDITPQIAVYTESGSNVLYEDGSQTSTSVFSTGAPVSGTTIGVAYDSATRKIWFASNNVYANTGNPAAGSGETGTLSSSGTAFPTVSARGSSDTLTLRFESSDFVYSAPSGFKELNTANLTAPTYQGVDYFDATIYEGNGSGQRVGDFVPYTDLYTVDNSIIFDGPGVKNHLQRTMSAAASDSNKKFTLSAWAKRVSISDTYAFSLLESTDSGGGNAAGIRIYSTSSGTGNMYFQLFAQGSGVSGGNVNVTTVGSAVQTASWQHFFIQVDTTQSTASDRIKLYIDGVLQEVDNSGGSAAVYPDQDAEFYLGDNDFATQIGKIPYGAYYSSMYIAEHAFLTGTNSTGKTISDFGAVDTATNKWVPKDISGFTFGHNGHYLEFKVTPGSSNGAGTDTSGNGNHFAEAINNSASAWSSYTYYQTVDAPTKNYAVLSQVIGPTPSHSSGGDADMSDGNLRFTLTGGTNSNSSTQTPSEAFAIQEGKWYFEVEAVTLGQAWNHVGLVDVDDYAQIGSSSTISDAIQGQWAYSINNASTSPDAIIADGTFSYGSDSPYNGVSNHKVDTGDVLGVHIERTGNVYKMWFSRNGTHYLRNTTQQPIIEFSTRGRVVPFARATNGSGNRELHFNFGQQLVFDGSSSTFNAASDGYWKNAPASGYKALNQDNLDATASKLTAWAWIKNRDASDSNILVDRVRGAGKVVHTNETAVEASEPDTVQRFLQRGVQVGNDVQVNTDRESSVLWQWLVGSSATTTTPSGGSIASTVAAADAGHFSVVGFTGATGVQTIAHGMAGTPEMMIFINREQSGANRTVYHKEIGNNNYILLSSTAAKPGSTNINYFNNTDPNSTVFTIGSGATPDTNGNGQGMIVYCFRSVPGVCKVGSYEGNNNADGTYVNLGFKPAWVMTKTIDATGAWGIYDSKRDIDNPVQQRLFGNANSAEDTDGEQMDFLSNGFKLRKTGGHNNNNQTYIYLAMAEIGGNGTLPPIYGR